MRPIKRLIPLEEALRIVLGTSEPTNKKETVPLVDASGRIAAESVVSRIHVPPFTRSAMDGYAVRAADTIGSSRLKPRKLSKTEAIYAGLVPKRALGKNQCAEIATGAMLPKGADAVVMVEDTELEEGEVLIYQPVHKGQNVSRKGEDIAPDTTLLKAGEQLNPSKIGALAAIGKDRVTVYAKPLVAVVPTGNEIAPLGSRLSPGQVYNINSYTLGAVAKANGSNIRHTDIVADTLEDLESAVTDNTDCDVLVFSGGSSVGERDIILDVLERRGKVLFHGVAMKPGKPTIFGLVGRLLVFGMPGYPTACLSNAYIMLAPVLRRIARLPDTAPPSVDAKMASRVVSTTGRTQFLTVRIENGLAYPAFKESGAITSMAFADGYVVIPADVDLLEKGEAVKVFLL